MRIGVGLILLVLALVATGASPAYAGDKHCGGFGAVLGCPKVGGKVGDGAAVIDGSLTGGGGPGSGGPGSGGPGSSGSGRGSGAGNAVYVDTPTPCVVYFERYCRGVPRQKPTDPGTNDAVPGAPAVTIRDIAVFRPQSATQYMQPDGWIVVGLPTNFYAAIDRHVVAGTLLGAPADVRFTPVGYRWHYGDGNSAQLSTKGSAWGTLARHEFEATPTSHTYWASGTYVIELDVEYTAEYRFAGGQWIALRGTIVLPANDLIATAGDAVTVLVDRDCSQPPLGPGC